MPRAFMPLRGTGDEEKRTGFFFDFYEQWSGLVSRCNWYDFTVVHLGGEFDPSTLRWQFDVGLMGFELNVQYVYRDWRTEDD